MIKLSIKDGSGLCIIARARRHLYYSTTLRNPQVPFLKNFLFFYFFFKVVLRIGDFKLLLIIISLYGYFFHHVIGWLPIGEILKVEVVEKGGF